MPKSRPRVNEIPVSRASEVLVIEGSTNNRTDNIQLVYSTNHRKRKQIKEDNKKRKKDSKRYYIAPEVR